MKIWPLICSLLLIVIGCMFSCQKQQEQTNDQNEGTTTTLPGNSADLFEHKVASQLARHFTVSYHGNYKVVQTDATLYTDVKNGEGELKKDVLVLVQKGTQAPPLEGQLKNANLIYIPVETAAVNVQHAESFLRELELVDRINTIGGLYSYNNEMRNKALSGELGQVGYSWHSPPNIEVLLERKPEVFFMTMASLDHSPSLEKSRQLDIPTAAVFDWAEEDYLARAEWVKFYALFFNAEETANQVFQEIQTRIETLKALTNQTPEKPTSLWGYYSSKQRWVMQLTSFPAQYMRDAGLENILLPTTSPNADGIQTLTTEELMLKGKAAKHWVIGDIHAGPLPQQEIMESFDSWNSGQLYHNMERVDPNTNTSDWYATAIVRPDTVLADLIKLVHPDLLSGNEPVFLGRYDKEKQGPVTQ